MRPEVVDQGHNSSRRQNFVGTVDRRHTKRHSFPRRAGDTQLEISQTHARTQRSGSDAAAQIKGEYSVADERQRFYDAMIAQILRSHNRGATRSHVLDITARGQPLGRAGDVLADPWCAV